MGYANWGECDDKIETAVSAGVNVLIWFALSLIASPAGSPMISGGPNMTCVTEVAAKLDAAGLRTTHMISIGGWDAPHPDVTFSAGEWWDTWLEWNEAAAAPGFDGFDGIDWVSFTTRLPLRPPSATCMP